MPKRTVTNCVPPAPCSAWQASSARRLEAPITLVGLTALSVETRTNLRAPAACAARATTTVESTLLASAWNAFSVSISGTCL
ncbi:hypothetical protein D3C83_114990 [compost metagenome]